MDVYVEVKVEVKDDAFSFGIIVTYICKTILKKKLKDLYISYWL